MPSRSDIFRQLAERAAKMPSHPSLSLDLGGGVTKAEREPSVDSDTPLANLRNTRKRKLGQVTREISGKDIEVISIASDSDGEIVVTPPSPVTPESSKRVRGPNGADESYRKKPSFMEPQEMVVIKVQTDDGYSMDITAHKDFLTYHSRFFDKAFTGDIWKEGATNRMTFTTKSQKAFCMFVHWIYTQTVEADNQELDAHTLVTLWILADEVYCPKLQNDVIELLKAMDDLPTTANWLFHNVYEGTTDGSPLRQLFVDKCAAELKKIDQPGAFPADMIIDMYNAAQLIKEPKKRAHGRAAAAAAARQAAEDEATRYHVPEIR